MTAKHILRIEGLPPFIFRYEGVTVLANMIYQHTIRAETSCTGIGIHSGQPVCMAIKPAGIDAGIRFRRTDLATRSDIVAHSDQVSDVNYGTTLANQDGASIATVEHLLAACGGIGLDNACIEIDGPEIPIMDGSAAVFCDMITKAGLKPLSAPRHRIRILDHIEVSDNQKWARLSPSDDDGLTLSAEIAFPTSAIGVSKTRVHVTPACFVQELAFARTFGFAKDITALQAMGRARGGSLANAVLIDGETIVNPEGLRRDDECIRHKLLDAFGDLMLAGAPIIGLYTACQPGHALNTALVRALIQHPERWRRQSG